MATPAERAKAKHAHRHGRRHHKDPAKVARDQRAATLRASGWHGYGGPVSTSTDVLNLASQTGHLNPGQFVGYPGGFSTDAGNYTGVEAIEGAAGNGGAGGDGGGDSGGAAS